MIYNKPTIPKGTRYFLSVFVPYIAEYQCVSRVIYSATEALNMVKFAENTRIYGSFW